MSESNDYDRGMVDGLQVAADLVRARCSGAVWSDTTNLRRQTCDASWQK